MARNILGTNSKTTLCQEEDQRPEIEDPKTKTALFSLFDMILLWFSPEISSSGFILSNSNKACNQTPVLHVLGLRSLLSGVFVFTTVHYLLPYLFRLNTLKGTAKAPAMDLLRLKIPRLTYQNRFFNP